MNDQLKGRFDALRPLQAAKMSDLMDRANKQFEQMAIRAKQSEEFMVKASREKIEKENRFRSDLIEQQQQIITLQRSLLNEARKNRWKTSLLVGIACAVITLIIQALIGLI